MMGKEEETLRYKTIKKEQIGNIGHGREH